MEEVQEEDNGQYFLPPGLLEDDLLPTEPMDIPNVGDSTYFVFPPPRKFNHPPDGIISSRILPDESNLIRCSTDLKCDFEIPTKPDYNAFTRMMSSEYQKDYSNAEEKPLVLHHGEIYLNFKQ